MSQTYNQSMIYLRNLADVIEKYLGSDLTETLEALNQGIGALNTLEDMYSKLKNIRFNLWLNGDRYSKRKCFT